MFGFLAPPTSSTPENHFLFIFSWSKVSALSVIGPARPPDSSVSCTKETNGPGPANNEQLLLQCYIQSSRGVGKPPGTMAGFESSEALSEAPLWLGFLALGSIVGFGFGVGAVGSQSERGPSSAPTFHRHRWGGVEGAGVEVEVEEGSGRRNLLWWRVNVEVALHNTRARCLCPPAGDFLTATFSQLNYTSRQQLVFDAKIAYLL